MFIKFDNTIINTDLITSINFLKNTIDIYFCNSGNIKLNLTRKNTKNFDSVKFYFEKQLDCF